jgi:hypothetical protein
MLRPVAFILSLALTERWILLWQVLGAAGDAVGEN